MYNGTQALELKCWHTDFAVLLCPRWSPHPEHGKRFVGEVMVKNRSSVFGFNFDANIGATYLVKHGLVANKQVVNRQNKLWHPEGA